MLAEAGIKELFQDCQKIWFLDSETPLENLLWLGSRRFMYSFIAPMPELSFSFLIFNFQYFVLILDTSDDNHRFYLTIFH
jgi:hypothetical protein